MAVTRARESEIDEIRGAVSTSEQESNNLRQRLQVSGNELRCSEDALRSAQRQNRSLKQRLDAAVDQLTGLQEALTALDTQKDDAQVCIVRDSFPISHSFRVHSFVECTPNSVVVKQHE